MKAVICEKYGPPEVLQVKQNIDVPAPKDNEILIKVYATSVNAADCNMRGLTHIPRGLGLLARLMLGINRPKIRIQGSVFAGIVESKGKNVSDFEVGDKVYGTGDNLGAYGEFLCRKTDGAIGIMPENISFEEAAVVPYGALTALYFLKNKANIHAGQKVLVIGASGSVGSYAVQLSKHFGAVVTGVCSTRNVDFVRSLGANNVIDYKNTNLLETNKKWDIIFDVVVGKTSFSKYKKLIAPNGYYLAVAGGLADMLQMIVTSLIGGKKVIFGGGADCEIRENVDFITRLIEKGALNPIVDRIFEIDDIVEAHRYVESGSKKANVAVTVSNLD